MPEYIMPLSLALGLSGVAYVLISGRLAAVRICAVCR